jgi:DNA-directed RNA polymerase subunit F
MEILEENPINIWELEEEIKKIKKRDKEVNYRVGKVEDFLNFCQKTKPSSHKDLKKELLELNVPRLREQHINKLIDIMPTTSDEVKVVLDGYPITVAKTNFDAIAKVIKKQLKK